MDIEENLGSSNSVLVRFLLKEHRERARMSQEALAEAMGISRITVNRLENGKRDFKREYLENAARVLDVAVADFFTRPEIPLVGKIGAGGEVYAIGAYPKGDGMDRIEPDGYWSPSAVAVVVSGNSMYDKYHAGDILVYDEQNPEIERFIGRRECIVGLPDERIMVKRVTRGSRDGLYTLTSWNSPPIEDVAVDWCARIRSVKFREE